MQIRYYQSAWNDIRNSEGWFGKLCLLALIGLIPVFGQIVVGGYLYGWAREMAWGVHEPMPAKIFGNEDGKLYRRGWFVLVVAFVFGLIPAIITSIGSSMQQAGFYSFMDRGFGAAMDASIALGSTLYFVGILLALFVSILAWIGSMRVSIYDRLSPGFQFGAIWKMFRRDTGGIMRIFGMNLLVGLILGIILSILFTILVMIVVLAGIGGLVSAGYSFELIEYMTEAQAVRFLVQFVASAGVVGVFCMLVGIYVCSLSSVFVDTLVARALGYWTWQFDVPNWGGPTDPLPFERVAATPMPQPYQQAVAQQPTAQQPVAATWQQPEPTSFVTEQDSTAAHLGTEQQDAFQESTTACPVDVLPSQDSAPTPSFQEEAQVEDAESQPSSEDWDSRGQL